MVQTLPKTQLVTFKGFIKWKPEGGFYELYDGEITKDESATRKTRKQNWVFNDRVSSLTAFSAEDEVQS